MNFYYVILGPTWPRSEFQGDYQPTECDLFSGRYTLLIPNSQVEKQVQILAETWGFPPENIGCLEIRTRKRLPVWRSGQPLRCWEGDIPSANITGLVYPCRKKK